MSNSEILKDCEMEMCRIADCGKPELFYDIKYPICRNCYTCKYLSKWRIIRDNTNCNNAFCNAPVPVWLYVETSDSYSRDCYGHENTIYQYNIKTGCPAYSAVSE
jgi:hypothetical protein